MNKLNTARCWPLLIAVLLGLVLTGCTFSVSMDRVESEPAPSAPASSMGIPTQTQTGAQECANSIPGACFAENVLATLVQYLAFFAELCGALVIGVAVLRGILRFIPHIIGPEYDDSYKENIRLQLGKSLALALEFEIGADILKTAVAPSFTGIAQLAAIVALRTLLNYFLERELRQTEERRAGLHLGQDTPREPQSGS